MRSHALYTRYCSGEYKDRAVGTISPSISVHNIKFIHRYINKFLLSWINEFAKLPPPLFMAAVSANGSELNGPRRVSGQTTVNSL